MYAPFPATQQRRPLLIGALEPNGHDFPGHRLATNEVVRLVHPERSASLNALRAWRPSEFLSSDTPEGRRRRLSSELFPEVVAGCRVFEPELDAGVPDRASERVVAVVDAELVGVRDAVPEAVGCDLAGGPLPPAA